MQEAVKCGPGVRIYQNWTESKSRTSSIAQATKTLGPVEYFWPGTIASKNNGLKRETAGMWMLLVTVCSSHGAVRTTDAIQRQNLRPLLTFELTVSLPFHSERERENYGTSLSKHPTTPSRNANVRGPEGQREVWPGHHCG